MTDAEIQLGPMARSAAFRLAEAVVVPTALFYVFLTTCGLLWAVWVSLGWLCAVSAWRAWRSGSSSAFVVLSLLTALVRAILTQATHSALAWFGQPILVTVLVAALFGATAFSSRPLIVRLADDLGAIPTGLLDHASVRRALRGVSLLWSALLLTQAAVTTLALLQLPLTIFVIARPLLIGALSLAGIVISTRQVSMAARQSGMCLRVSVFSR